MATALSPFIPPTHPRGGVRFGTRLRKARMDRGLSIEGAARRIGICASTLHRLETGDRGAGFSIAQAITAFYRISITDLQQDVPG